MGTEPSPYEAVDGAINCWVERHGLTLHTEWEGEARFWYTSRGNECFQVSVERPVGDSVQIQAWSVETEDDAELHRQWSVSLGHLDQGLAAAIQMIDHWAARARSA